MKLNELLDSKIKLKIESESNDEFKCSTVINGRTYGFQAFDINEDQEWEVAFYLNKKNIFGDSKFFDLTFNNSQLKVFSFVKESMLEFIKNKKPNIITFESNNNKRSETYIKLIKKVAPNNYKLLRWKQENSQISYFILVNVNFDLNQWDKMSSVYKSV